MKVATLPQTNIVCGSAAEVEMGFTREGMIAAARMFRDQIYTNKPWAVVREIIANAIDEHRKHNVAAPVEITLPTADDPHFRVRDYGKGLDQAGVFGVFFQYFASTKRDSDISIGGFGIGAKSPLAYADCFYVTSWFGGEKICYVASLDGDSSKAYHMDKSLSDEPTGIEVAVPVAQADFPNFKRLVSYFAAMAKFTNFTFSDEIQAPDTFLPKEVFSCDHGQVVKWDNPMFKSTTNLYVRDGDVIYPVDQVDGLNNPFRNKATAIVTVDRAINPVDIAPSRERIDMSKMSVATINRALQSLSDEAKAHVLSLAANCKNAREKFAAQRAAQAISFTLGQAIIDTWKVRHRSGGCLAKIKVYENAKSYNRYMGKGEVCGRSWQNIKELDCSVDNVIFVAGSQSPRIDALVAFAKKQKGMVQSDPNVLTFYVVRADACGTQNVNGVDVPYRPADWIEGVDYWVFDENSVTAEERKATRAEYASPSTPVVRAAKANEVVRAAKANEVVGRWAKNFRFFETLSEIRSQASTKRIIVYPLCNCEFIGDWNNHDQANTLAEYLGTPIFMLCSNKKEVETLKESGIKFTLADGWKKEITPIVKAKLEASRCYFGDVPNLLGGKIMQTLPKQHTARVELEARDDHTEVINILDLTLDPDPNPTVLALLVEKWGKVSGLDKEALGAAYHYSSNFPLLEAKAKPWWKEFFVLGNPIPKLF